jgi:hypothetical protein
MSPSSNSGRRVEQIVAFSILHIFVDLCQEKGAVQVSVPATFGNWCSVFSFLKTKLSLHLGCFSASIINAHNATVHV